MISIGFSSLNQAIILTSLTHSHATKVDNALKIRTLKENNWQSNVHIIHLVFEFKKFLYQCVISV